MSGIFGVQREISLKKTTNATAVVPNHDVCRLSYYLRCGTLLCGIKGIASELLDFETAHRLPQHRQDTIFKLAYKDYGLEVLANATIFLDDEHGLTGGDFSNEFFDVESVSSVLAVNRHVLIAGETRQVAKIMVCDAAWLNRNYVEPLQRNKARLRRILGPSREEQLADGLAQLFIEAMKEAEDEKSRHCSHCKGSSGPCACRYGCRVTNSDTDCSAAHRHCAHCKGLDAKCGCEHGCPAKAESLCKVVHTTITCGSCFVSGIPGARYKCRDCSNYDLCEECHNNGAHIMTHSFERIARVGSKPVMVRVRVAPAPPSSASKAAPVSAAHRHCEHCTGLNTKCGCEYGCPAKAESLCRVVHSNVTCGSCFLSGITGARYRRRDRSNYNLCEECYYNGGHIKTHSFERIARVGSEPAIILPPPPSFGTKAVPVTPEAVPIATVVDPSLNEGQTVRVVGLTKNPERNGRCATVLRILGENKIIVAFPNDGKKITVSTNNLEIVPPSTPVGSVVELKGISGQPQLKSCLAVVVDHVAATSPGRVSVQLLDDKSRTLSIKPENMDMLEDES